MLRLPRGPFIKYVTLFWTNLTPFPFHTLSYISRPPKVRHTSRNPPTFSSTCIHTYVFTGRFVLVRGGSCLGFSSEIFVWKVLFGVVCVRPPFCQNTSVTTESLTSFSILGFICRKNLKSVTSHALGPP